MNYTAKKITPLGEFSEKYGQRYWGYVQEADMPVSFNLMNPVDVDMGKELSFEEKSIKESSKGTEYLFLRKVKISGSQGEEAAKASSPERLKSGNSQTAAGTNDKYLKDNSTTPLDLFRACLPYSDFNTLMEGSTYYTEYMEFVRLASEDLLKMMENIRSGEKIEEKPLKGIEKARATRQGLDKEVIDTADDLFPDEE